MIFVDFQVQDDKEELLTQTSNLWKQFVATVKVGDVTVGTVAEVREYGIYLDIHESFPVLLEVPNLCTARRIVDLKSLPKVGEQVSTTIIQLVESRRLARGTENPS